MLFNCITFDINGGKLKIDVCTVHIRDGLRALYVTFSQYGGLEGASL